MDQYYYNSTTGQTYSAEQMQSLFGINVETTSIQVINLNKFYPVQPSAQTFDPALYTATSAWTLVSISPSGQGAELVYTPVAKTLVAAKEGASEELKMQASIETDGIVLASGLSNSVLTSVASQDPLTRSPLLQDTLDQLDAVSIALGNDLAAVDACTTVDQINNLINPPTGTLNTGRNGEDLIYSVYTEFNSLTLTPSDTELYIPGSDTTILCLVDMESGISYFPATPSAFAVGNYNVQIRETATSNVFAAFTLPDTEGAGIDIPF